MTQQAEAIAVDSLVMSLLRRGHRSSQRVLFNIAAPALSMFAASKAFFAAAGALDYPLRTFIVVVALGRAARYGAIAAIALSSRRMPTA